MSVHYGVAGNIRSERKPFEPDQDNRLIGADACVGK